MKMVSRRLIGGGIILFWLLMLLLLYERHYGPLWKGPSHGALPDPEIDSGKERWMGIYLKGEKVGYTHISTKKEGEGYRVSEKVSMKLNVLGSFQNINTLTDALLSKDYLLRSFNFEMYSDTTSIGIKGDVVGKRMVLSVVTAGSRSQQEIALKDEPYMNLGLTQKILRDGLRDGKVFRFNIFDPSSMSQQEIEIEIEGKERVRVMGIERDAYRLKANFKGINLLSWIDEEGETLKEESPMGLVMIKESREDALRVGPHSARDIIAETVIFPNLYLKDPDRVTYLKIRLKDVSLEGFDLDGGRQTFKGDTLEIKKEDLTMLKGFQVRDRGFKEFLESTSFIQSNDPRIIEKAREIIGEERDSLSASRLINDWVFKNIEKSPVLSIPSALEVLNLKKGDCNEHTTLFVALARSVGIPARASFGLAYTKGGFYYHAWPEVYVGEWFSLDPTSGQIPADVTHIRFLTGGLERQAEILKILGKISIEILEYR